MASILAGCGATDFACSGDDACVDGGRVGSCEPTGHCSFPDGGCASGRRYGEHAGGISGQCVPADVASDDDGASAPATVTATATATAGESGASADDDGSSGAVDTAGGASGSTGTTAGADVDAESSATAATPDEGALYGPCANDLDRCDAAMGGSCLTAGDVDVCAQPCVDHADCPPAPDGSATSCASINDEMVCVIPCVGMTCPVGMTCALFFVCMW